MNRLRWVVPVALAALAWGSASVAGDGRTFTVTNRSGQAVAELSVSLADRGSFGSDILGVDTLGDGEVATVTCTDFRSEDCVFDIRVRNLEGTEWIAQDVDLCAEKTVSVPPGAFDR